MTQPTTGVPTTGAPATEITAEARRRRTFAVISHPDAGKSTLTEALLLHAHAITTAGATHGKAGRRGTVSDWMAMEQARGISVTSAAIQFEYRDSVINLVDTPGHADFSEDTYRVLSAVDAAVMLVDASKGLEVQTMKLFDVCRQRNLPVITVINKWDRPGLDALALMDEIRTRTGLLPTPLTWPVGVAGDFRGVIDRSTEEFIRFTRTAGGATAADSDRVPFEVAATEEGEAWVTATEESELLGEEGQDHDEATFLANQTTPVLFAAAVLNFGVQHILDTLVDFAPAAEARVDAAGGHRPVASPFSGFVFKVQSGMNASHRDYVAFVRVCSGQFRRGMIVTHAASGRPFATKYAQHLFGREREVADEAWPGDIVGLVNASALRVGDSIFESEPVEFPPLPMFAPEHFRAVRSADSSKHKQFRRGIDQLDHEGVIQVLRSDLRGDQAPVLGAVGPMQFEVVEERMTHDFGAAIRSESLPYQIARRTNRESAEILGHDRQVEVLMRSDGTLLALFSTPWRLRNTVRDHPELMLEDLAAGALEPAPSA
ncbi:MULTISPECIES: peptide chain release factor 3 [Cryobacterium]|uniref:Peptide chain release factor 3 n=1 Tax=Cryobacterium glucosi TaxID=1259175 RepID=A0ABY2IM37_9MICO|nr:MULTISPECIES: peptide chain release factor 3 [Cryobacterium]MDY7527157.1 peptide chain release factor 3 [Cryobacterium sp. 10C2]MEB0002053.1 peptide chain release factor 3 [Cryobacterium sp. RTC2.1]MEB0200348.1 peptide chain release factor 3 [Cryobacterium sp. 5I3]MEB0286624.1 peptide chain release factor 3 [Cryobacterium sp. 10S3]MEB0290767.1 peptide chain release factor 3 [Cryobacterium sp. 10C2]